MAGSKRQIRCAGGRSLLQWAEQKRVRFGTMERRTGALLLSLLLICVDPQRQGSGGALAWWVVAVVCARTPSLISVLVPGWLRSGDMMVDGVFRDAVRPLCL